MSRIIFCKALNKLSNATLFAGAGREPLAGFSANLQKTLEILAGVRKFPQYPPNLFKAAQKIILDPAQVL